MTEAEGRAAVVAEAMTWLGTGYHHLAKVKGVGVDCAQFVLAVYAKAGLIEDFQTETYPADWHMHRSAERYMEQVLRFAREIPVADAGPGDVLLFRFGRAFAHGAIITQWPQVIHASLHAGAVVLADADRDSDLIERPVRAFSIWDLRQ